MSGEALSLEKDLKSYLEEISPLIDCFAVIGLTSKDVENYTEYGEVLQPKILSQFPPANFCKINIPDTLSIVSFT
jgi:hypothetical protein